MLHQLTYGLIAATVAAGLAGPAQAADDPHIRGEITAIDGSVYSVETASGQSVEVTLAEDATVLLYSPLSLSDIKADDYLGIPSGPAQGGGKQALAVVVFPDTMRGFNEGEASWDLLPGSRMTNATLAQVTANDDVGTLSVTYGGQSEEIAVPAQTPIVTFTPAPEREVVVGELAIFFAKETDTGYTAGLVGISEDGSLPPL